jgi:transposase
MASRGRPKAELVVSEAEREALVRLARRPSVSQAVAERARIVLACVEGETNAAVASRLGVSGETVGKWRRRFVELRLDGLVDAPRPGQPRKITDEHVAEVIRRTLEQPPPDGGTHWSTRQMASATGLNQTAISRIWRTFALAPHRVEHWKLSKDPLFVEKVRDIVGVYLDPPERAVVLCVDEKSQIQALDRSQPTLPMLPGTPARATHDYRRHGTTTLFAALDAATGKVIGSMHARHRASEFRKFLIEIDTQVPADLHVHLILDNYATHKTPQIKRWLLAHPRFVLHFTPTGASWLNLVERWFAELTRRRLQRATHRSVAELTADINAWLEHWNENPRPFVWTKTADQIHDTIRSYLERINDSGH